MKLMSSVWREYRGKKWLWRLDRIDGNGESPARTIGKTAPGRIANGIEETRIEAQLSLARAVRKAEAGL